MRPVMLYVGEVHHAHKNMGDQIGCEYVKIPLGTPLERIKWAMTNKFPGRTIITEGGESLFEAVWLKRFGNCDNIIHLAADETVLNIFDKYDHYKQHERLIHFSEHRYVDGLIGISHEICSKAQVLGVNNTKHVPPFTTENKYTELIENDPSFGSRKVLVVGAHSEKNNFESLSKVARKSEFDLTFEVIGPSTDDLDTYHVNGHGFVELEDFLDYFGEVEAFVMPAVSQMFCVAVVEAMHAGLPPVVTEDVGSHTIVEQVDPEFIARTDSQSVANALDRYLEMDQEQKKELSSRFQDIARYYRPEAGMNRFKIAYEQITANL